MKKKLLLFVVMLLFIFSGNGQERKIEKRHFQTETHSFFNEEDCVQHMIEKEKDTIYTIAVNKYNNKFGNGIYRDSKEVVPPAFHDIISLGNYYFQLIGHIEKGKQKEELIRIDPISDTYINLPYVSYFGTLSNGLQIFEQKGGLSGLVKNEKEIVFPFKYDLIFQIGNYIFCEKPYYEGVEIYDLNLNVIPDLGIVKFEYMSCIHNLLKIYKRDDEDIYEAKIGLLNLSLKQVTECKYYDIKSLNNSKDYFIIIKRHENKRDLLYGILNKDGDEVISPKYHYMDQKYGDSLIKIQEKENDEYRQISLKELLIENGN